MIVVKTICGMLLIGFFVVLVTIDSDLSDRAFKIAPLPLRAIMILGVCGTMWGGIVLLVWAISDNLKKPSPLKDQIDDGKPES